MIRVVSSASALVTSPTTSGVVTLPVSAVPSGATLLLIANSSQQITQVKSSVDGISLFTKDLEYHDTTSGEWTSVWRFNSTAGGSSIAITATTSSNATFNLGALAIKDNVKAGPDSNSAGSGGTGFSVGVASPQFMAPDDLVLAILGAAYAGTITITPNPTDGVFTQLFTHGTGVQGWAGYKVKTDPGSNESFSWSFNNSVTSSSVLFLSYAAILPLPRQASQRWDSLPVYDDIWHRHAFRARQLPLPSGIQTSQEGNFGTFNQITAVGQVGGYRVQNNIEGYLVYIGLGSLPDLTQPVTSYSATLPINIAITPPISGTETIYVVVRKRDTYGLISQNSDYTTFVIDSSGNLVMSPLVAPLLTLYAIASENTFNPQVKIVATYPGYSTDTNPATSWKVWYNTAPIVLTNPPLVYGVGGPYFTLTFDPVATGTIYVAVELYRASDGATAITYGTIVLNNAPSEVIPVPSGYQGS